MKYIRDIFLLTCIVATLAVPKIHAWDWTPDINLEIPFFTPPSPTPTPTIKFEYIPRPVEIMPGVFTDAPTPTAVAPSPVPTDTPMPEPTDVPSSPSPSEEEPQDVGSPAATATMDEMETEKQPEEATGASQPARDPVVYVLMGIIAILLLIQLLWPKIKPWLHKKTATET